jgi:transposase
VPHVRLRLSHSGKAIHRIYPTQAQEAFLEGHVEAFSEIGGVPVRHIRYDNLTSAVTAVVFGQGRQRQENDRWVLFRSHYGFDAFYCQPGIAGPTKKAESREKWAGSDATGSHQCLQQNR